MQVAAKGQGLGASKSQRCFSARSSDREFGAMTQRVTHACNHSAKIIAKYMTDDEKLHLGVPLARYEGGHDSPQPLDWRTASEASTESSLSGDCSSLSSTGREKVKTAAEHCFNSKSSVDAAKLKRQQTL